MMTFLTKATLNDRLDMYCICWLHYAKQNIGFEQK